MTKPTRYRSIPRTGQQGADTQAIIENMEVLTGNRGDGLFRALTPYDLQELGIVKVNIRNGRQIIELPEVGEQTESIVETPSKPQNVVANGGFSSVLITWDKPTYKGHAHAEIFRSDVDNFGNAVLIGTSIAPMYPDPVGPDASNYYWVRFINVNGEEGPLHDTHGVLGETAIDPELLLDKLSGQITETQLYKDLTDRIDLIDLDGTGLVDRLDGEISARNQAIQSVQQQVDGLRIATDIDIYYQATMPSGDDYAEGSRWFDESDNLHPYVWINGAWRDARDGEVAVLGSAINTERLERINADDAQAAIINEVSSIVLDPATGVIANSNGLSALDSRTTINEGAIESYASRLDSLEATAYNIEYDLTADAQALEALDARVTSNTSSLNSQSQSLNLLSNKINDPNTGLSASAAALEQVTSRVTINEGQISSQASSVSQLQSTVGSHTTAIAQQSTVVDGLSAQYTVKIDNNGFVSGYGLSSTTSGYDGQQHSEMIFNVHRFSIGNPELQDGGKLTFVVDTSPEGGGKVVMDAAYIKDASITSAKIHSVNTDKLVVTDQAQIFNAIIADASITSAKIAGHIQSDNYVHNGGVGWAINKNGAAVFNNIYARGNIEASSIKADSVEAKHIKGGAVSSMDSFTKTGLNVIYGQSVFALGISCDIPDGESGNVMVLVNFQGQAASRNTNMGVAIYGLYPGGSVLLHTSDRSVDSDFTESSSTSYIWKNAPAGSSIHVYMRNTHSTGQILNGVVICNRLTTIR